MVDEQHDRLEFLVVESDEMEAVGDLDLGVPQPVRQRAQRGVSTMCPPLIATISPAQTGAVAKSPRPWISLAWPLTALSVM